MILEIHPMMLYVRHSKTNLSGNTMKNISLVLIALLLFTFPLFAQTNRSNFMYQWKNGSKYFGEWENGTLHGEGTYTYGIGEGAGDKYVGDYRNGIRSGKGIYTWFNG